MSWEHFKKDFLYLDLLPFGIDVSRLGMGDDYLKSMQASWAKAFKDMTELEKGAIANPDENRMVGHYWLRNPDLAPQESIGNEIKEAINKIEAFAQKVHTGHTKGACGAFENIVCVGIGGSALGPQLAAQALGHPVLDKLKVYFVDNTDPDGIDKTLLELEGQLGRTLVLVTSKSGSTPEPRNAMLELEAAYKEEGLSLSDHAVAITSEGSKLHRLSKDQGWVEQFPMWDWVGGRTSETAAVGLLPAALQGIDIRGFLAGAKAMDEATRTRDYRLNPAALLALGWHFATRGRGEKDMVILPYKDRLMLLSRYLQQLVMESLGKKYDLSGKEVFQGIAVYGNKGSTDQHAYVQQLRDGVPNFFVTFIEVLEDREGPSIEVDPGVTSGDYLQAFLMGTKEALSEGGRPSITLTVKNVSAFTLGLLIALYERAVGYYASFVNINAYHQPGVEAGKKAAASVLELQAKVMDKLRSQEGNAYTAELLAHEVGAPAHTEQVFKILMHMAFNADKRIAMRVKDPVWESEFVFKP